ncbi:MAG: hypothetical protein KDC24_11410, partial [Saprospiraceae bacterium]|nr:hypothetical protein [Saprospiraceae bacterium]
MQKKIYFLLLFFGLLQGTFTTILAQSQLVVELKTDEFPYDTYWQIEQSGKVIKEKPRGFQRNTLFRDTVNLADSVCYSFTIFDYKGNGLCCEDGDGYYALYLNGQLVKEGGDFQFMEYTYLNCANGNGCAAPLPAQLGQTTFENANERWYEFSPDTTGRYLISTCNNTGNCPTKIWCYNRCHPNLTGRDRPGTLFYAENSCGNHAEISATLFKDSTYLIRIGSEPWDCISNKITWSLSFEGIASGCTDPLACNYDPSAAEDDGSCIYNGDPNCPDGPDLAIDEQRFKTSLRRSVLNNADACLLQEGCIKGYGQRTIIRFDTWIDNIGNTDYFVGRPPNDVFSSDPIWEFDICHNHWHYEGYASYHLYDENGNSTPVGFKNGFCVMDVGCNPGSSPSYNCQFQGISTNCFDLYDSYLDCQWIDITDVAPGAYTLVTQVNTLRNPDALGRNELGYGNNWAQVCIEIFEDQGSGYKGFIVKEDCERYVDCLGELQGNAQPDCAGNCNGIRIQGDLDLNADRNSQDVLLMIYGALEDTL